MAATLADIRAIPALKALAEASLTSLAPLMVKRTFLPGELIFLEGEHAIGLWFILEGRVRIIKFSASGRTQALCIAKAGKCFGTCPLFGSEENPANAQAIDKVTLLVLPHDDSQRLLQTDPTLARALMSIYSQRLSQLARLSEGLGSWSVGLRINDCLLEHADHAIVTLTHEKIADLVGTVREVVSRHLAQLEQEGIVHLAHGQILIQDVEALKSVCLIGNQQVT